MDDRTFDVLTKFIGRRSSRRAIIKAAIAGAVVSVFGSSSARAALSPIRTRPGLCIQPGQPCNVPGSDPSRDCCYKCNSSTHTCCEVIGYECTVDSDCCVTLVAGQSVQPICRDPNTKDADRRRGCFLPGTLDPGAECAEDSDCISGACLNGVCQPCTAEQIPCDAGCCNPANCQTCANASCTSRCGPCQTCDGNGNCVATTCPTCQQCNPATGQCDPICNAALCQTCSPATGACEVCGGDRCQACRNGTCVAACTLCQTCDPASGACTSMPCPTCQQCNPANGECVANCLDPCRPCNPTSGQCEARQCGPCQVCQGGACVSTCNDCQVCQGNGCVPLTCGPCQTCQGGSCVDTCNLCESCVDGVCTDNCPDGLCDPTTGDCTPLECSPCQAIRAKTCVESCAICEVCEPGGCVAKCSDPCAPCDEAGNCTPITCGPCQFCDPESGTCTGGCPADQCLECVDNQCVDQCLACQDCNAGICEDACLHCRTCDPQTEQCISDCTHCQICDRDLCVDKCTNLCAPCDVEGNCTPIDCDPCQTCDGGTCVDKCPGDDCDPISGVCTPATCGPCATLRTSPTRICEDVCSDCQICTPLGCVNKCIDQCSPCDLDTGQCTEIDCGLCQVCNGGTCVDKCPLGQTCDSGTGACSGGCSPCEADLSGLCVSACTDCQICEATGCVAKCTDPCAPCDASGRCTQIDCGMCQICEGGTCVDKCPGQTCNPTTGICTTPTCGPCETLEAGTCVDACTACQVCGPSGCVDKCTNACAPCDADGNCTPIVCPACQSCDGGICVNDCLACETCNAGFCEDACSACLTCDPDTETCSGGCPAEQCLECVANRCVSTCGACETCDAGVCADRCDPTAGCLCSGLPVIFAGRTGCGAGSELTIDWSANNAITGGAMHSNSGIKIGKNPAILRSTGSNNVFGGPVTYVCNGEFGGNNNHYLGGIARVGVRPFPVSFTVDDFTCTYGSLTTGGDFDLSDDGPWWVDGRKASQQLNPGTYCAQGKLRLDENKITGTVTFIGMEEVELTGNGCVLQAFEHDVLFFSPATSPNDNTPAVKVSGNSQAYTGLMYAPNGEVDYAGNNGSALIGAIVGWTVEISGNNFLIGGRACTGGGLCPPTG